MTYILARLKRKSVQLCKVMSHEGDILEIPNIVDAKAFDPHYKADDDQWLTISKFSTTAYADAGLGSVINTLDMTQLKPAQVADIRFLCVVQGPYRLYQRLPPANIIRKKFIEVSGQFSLAEDKQIIVFNTKPDAIHNVENDTLYFTDFSRLKYFFSKIEELYREATNDEVISFLNEDIINVVAPFDSGAVTKPNRRRIALVKEKISRFSKQQVEHLMQDFPNYIGDVKIENGAFVINNDNDLKLAIYCMEERFYTTPVSSERRLANSVLKITI